MFGRLKFKGVDKKRISDEAHVEDYKAAPEIGRVRLGKLCMYYRDLGVKYYVPYDYIERCFGRIADKKRKLYNGMLKCDLFMYGKRV